MKKLVPASRMAVLFTSVTAQTVAPPHSSEAVVPGPALTSMAAVRQNSFMSNGLNA